MMQMLCEAHGLPLPTVHLQIDVCVACMRSFENKRDINQITYFHPGMKTSWFTASSHR